MSSSTRDDVTDSCCVLPSISVGVTGHPSARCLWRSFTIRLKVQRPTLMVKHNEGSSGCVRLERHDLNHFGRWTFLSFNEFNTGSKGLGKALSTDGRLPPHPSIVRWPIRNLKFLGIFVSQRHAALPKPEKVDFDASQLCSAVFFYYLPIGPACKTDRPFIIIDMKCTMV